MTRGLVIRGVHYDNSAAKFWPSFLDEVAGRFPMADRCVLSACCGGFLHPGLLTPAQSLAAGMGCIDESFDMAAAMQGVAAEIEAAGPPPNVSLSVLSGESLLQTEELSDFLDAEVFPFLLVWLLEWSCMSEASWNRARVRGRFKADDPDRSCRYCIRFELENRYLSEGLCKRLVRLQWEVADSGGAP